MNCKIAAALVALPVGALSFLPQSASAAEIQVSSTRSQPLVVAQRYDDRRDFDQRTRARREEFRRNEFRRDEHRRVWIPGHWESGFLGIGRKWVAGHWETR